MHYAGPSPRTCRRVVPPGQESGEATTNACLRGRKARGGVAAAREDIEPILAWG